MRTTGTLLLLLILSARLYAGEILDSTETDLGSGFHELHTTEINGKFQYLYYHDRKLGQFGSYSISPSGHYAAFHDVRTGQIFLFRSSDQSLEQLTRESIKSTGKYTWNEKFEILQVTLPDQAEPLQFALE